VTPRVRVERSRCSRAPVSRRLLARVGASTPDKWIVGIVFLLFATARPAFAEASASALPDAGTSVLRVFGALLIVLSLFFGGVWLFKNSQRFMGRQGGAGKLSVLEVKSLGNRQALYVVGYGRQRMLLGSSPAGVSLVSQLPEATEQEQPQAVMPSFGDTLQRVLNRK
jgi:flagellar biogenesis protein FliO